MKCLRKYKWLKLPRAKIPGLKGLMSCYLKLAYRAAFRKGTGIYCGYENPVEPGMWAGGVVGLKSILGIRSRQKALQILDVLQKLGYLTYTLEAGTKKLTYRITDWVVQCSGQECQDEAVYVTPGYGFLCMPRDITERLAASGHVFGDADAWLDLWCHTVFRDYGNAFSFLAPAVQFGKYGAVLTLETLGQRWGWEKTKVWRFLHKLENEFPLYRLPGSFGCVIFNMGYPAASEIQAPEEADVKRIMDLIRFSARNTHYEGYDNARINRFVAWKTRKIMAKLREVHEQNQSEKSSEFGNESDSRVAVLPPIIRAYFSHGRNCKYGRKCIYDCPGFRLGGRKNPFYHGMGVVYPFSGDGGNFDASG